MRFKHTIPKPGTRRTITTFLFFPLRIKEKQESGSCLVCTRWLETVKIEQKWTTGAPWSYWENKRFL